MQKFFKSIAFITALLVRRPLTLTPSQMGGIV